MTLKEFRCSKCNKLLGKIDGRAEIVCPRCKTVNYTEVKPNISAASIVAMAHEVLKGESQDDQNIGRGTD